MMMTMMLFYSADNGWYQCREPGQRLNEIFSSVQGERKHCMNYVLTVTVIVTVIVVTEERWRMNLS